MLIHTKLYLQIYLDPETLETRFLHVLGILNQNSTDTLNLIHGCEAASTLLKMPHSPYASIDIADIDKGK